MHCAQTYTSFVTTSCFLCRRKTLPRLAQVEQYVAARVRS